MTITVLDDLADLNTGSDALHEMAATLTGTTHLEMALTSTTLGGIKALGTQRVILGSTGSIEAQLVAIALSGPSSSVINEGSIKSLAGTAILFSSTTASTVTVSNASGKMIEGTKGIEIASTSGAKLELLNAGTVKAVDFAVTGGAGVDRIVNTGTITTTGVGATALDLKDGDDFYEGRQGTVVGIVKLGLGNDIAYGGSATETFSGGAGRNMIDGGGGDDLVFAGTGHNTIDGGSGTDTIDYSEAAVGSNTPNGFTINLGTGTAYNSQFTDKLANIETVIGSNHDDVITGDGLNNLLRGGDGNDTLEGGFNNDTLEGGAGNNTARFTGSTAAIVDLSNLQPQVTGYGTDKLVDIRNLEGGSGADKLTGNGEVNLLDGNSGNDTLVGKDGNDTLQGEAGNDTLEGGVGNDTLDGGSSADTAVFSGARGNYRIVNNTDGTITITDNVGQDGTDKLKDIRFAKFADQTIALVNGKPTSISPSTAFVSESAAIGATVATFFGSDPDGDTLTFSLVSDAGGLFGISGGKLVVKNALNYEVATQHTVTVKASDGWGGEFTKNLTITVRNNTAETTPIIRSGTNNNEQLVGEAGNDQLNGLGGKDTLFGEGGDDKLWGGLGNDTLVGGAGKDVFMFDMKPSAKSNLDWVVDFDVKDDTIHLSKKAFTKLAKKGALSKDAFVVGDHMRDKEDRILYHKKAGALFYDPDGTGSAKAVQFATITKNLAITAKDFYVI